MVERLSVKQEVEGSCPSTGANFFYFGAKMINHTIINTNSTLDTKDPFYKCLACTDWSTRSLSDVARHVVENQFVVTPPKVVKPKVSFHN